MQDSDPLQLFPPSPEAAAARIAAIDPRAYARTRNALDGQVTRLSPYVTHGYVHVPDVIAQLGRRHILRLQDRIVAELGWREYFHHVWRHLGDGIFESRRPPISDAAYADTMPDDILRGATGVPVIDAAVRALYETGYLHNHARLWLASYVVHLRKVDWRAGAVWSYGYLLDGDLAPNHLSWQWVAGTLTGRPYLFNADNVSRNAGQVPGWRSPGTAIDCGYDEIERIARSSEVLPAEPGSHPGVTPPGLFAVPPAGLLPQADLPLLAGRRVRLGHPWSLAAPGDAGLRIGVLLAPFHRRFPWSATRWRFVLARMREACDAVLFGEPAELDAALADAQCVALETRNPGYAEWLVRRVPSPDALPRFFDDPPQYCTSFSRFWERIAANPPL
jgi:deoxyribodipyrimidine photo-lyase